MGDRPHLRPGRQRRGCRSRWPGCPVRWGGRHLRRLGRGNVARAGGAGSGSPGARRPRPANEPREARACPFRVGVSRGRGPRALLGTRGGRASRGAVAGRVRGRGFGRRGRPADRGPACGRARRHGDGPDPALATWVASIQTSSWRAGCSVPRTRRSTSDWPRPWRMRRRPRGSCAWRPRRCSGRRCSRSSGCQEKGPRWRRWRARCQAAGLAFHAVRRLLQTRSAPGSVAGTNAGLRTGP